jgi:hypothetical protein
VRTVAEALERLHHEGHHVTSSDREHQTHRDGRHGGKRPRRDGTVQEPLEVGAAEGEPGAPDRQKRPQQRTGVRGDEERDDRREREQAREHLALDQRRRAEHREEVKPPFVRQRPKWPVQLERPRRMGDDRVREEQRREGSGPPISAHSRETKRSPPRRKDSAPWMPNARKAANTSAQSSTLASSGG